MKATVTSRETRVRIEDAPRVEGLTTGLRLRIVQPRRVIFFADAAGSNVCAECRGRVVLIEGTGRAERDGVLGTAFFSVKVSLGENRSDAYPEAPQWLVDLWAEVQ